MFRRSLTSSISKWWWLSEVLLTFVPFSQDGPQSTLKIFIFKNMRWVWKIFGVKAKLFLVKKLYQSSLFEINLVIFIFNKQKKVNNKLYKNVSKLYHKLKIKINNLRGVTVNVNSSCRLLFIYLWKHLISYTFYLFKYLITSCSNLSL